MRLTKEIVLSRSGNCDLESIFHLDLSRLQINDLGDVLSNCPYLVRLDLSHNNIVDTSPLEGCKELQWLNLSDNPALRDVDTLSQHLSLTSLFLINTRVSPSAITTLRAASRLPALTRLYMLPRPPDTPPASLTDTPAYHQAHDFFENILSLSICNGFARAEMSFLTELTNVMTTIPSPQTSPEINPYATPTSVRDLMPITLPSPPAVGQNRDCPVAAQWSRLAKGIGETRSAISELDELLRRFKR